MSSDSQSQLTDEGSASAREWLASKGATKTCDACGGNSWILDRNMAALLRYDKSQKLRVLMMYCENCGNVRMHVAQNIDPPLP